MNEQYHRIGKDGKKYWGKSGAGILFTDGHKILLLKRATGGSHFEAWCIPGGKVEHKENVIDAAKREAIEECGHFEGYRFADYEDIDGRFRFTTFLYAIEKPFDVKLSDEHSDYKWIDIEKVETLKLHPRFKLAWPSFKRRISYHFRKSFSDWVQHRDPTILPE